MRTLIVYDNTGNIYLQTTGIYTIPQGGVQYLEVEIPIDKTVVSIDVSVTPNVPIYEERVLTETEILQQRIEEQETALIELAELIGRTV